MDVRFLGTGGASGWPQPGCGCAACRRAGSDGGGRAPTAVAVDVGVGAVLRFSAGSGPLPVVDDTSRPRSRHPAHPLTANPASKEPGPARKGRRKSTVDPAERPPAGYRLRELPGGWEVTDRAGARLLVADRPDVVPVVPDDAEPYDAVLLDLLGNPTQLGDLRSRALVTERTSVAALFADHRAPSQPELARRCRLWRALAPADGQTLHVTSDGAGQPEKPADLPSAVRRVLVLGGASSGKSAEAELRAAAEPEVTYVATGPPVPEADRPRDTQRGSEAAVADREWAARVAAHRARRPRWWRTVETSDLAAQLRHAHGLVVVDSVTTWLAAAMDRCGAWSRPAEASRALAATIDDLTNAWRQVSADVVAVSDEAGLGIVPETAAGRLFRDELGRLNQRLAAESEEAVLVVAGRVLPLPL